MKSKLMMVFLFALMCSGAPALFADEHEHMMPPPYKGSADFEKLKGLAGTWVGTHKMGEKEEPVKAFRPQSMDRVSRWIYFIEHLPYMGSPP